MTDKGRDSDPVSTDAIDGGIAPANDDDIHLVILNVGGQVFITRRSTLQKAGVGRLSHLKPKDALFERNLDEYFFDRDPQFFGEVMQFYRTGELHLNGNYCPKTLLKEMEYWGLPESCVGDCCWRTYCQTKEMLSVDDQLVIQFASLSDKPIPEDSDGFKRRVWIFLENHTSSIYAKIWAIVCVTLLFLSILCYALTTLPVVKLRFRTVVSANLTEDERSDLEYSDSFLVNVVYIDVFCLSFFTIEFIARFLSTPSKLAFVKSFLFFCDILFLVPGWIVDGVVLSGTDVLASLTETTVTVIFLHIVTITRLFRIFRLAWNFRGIRILLYVLKASFQELLLLLVFVVIGVLMYGFLIYSAEVSSNENFDSAFRGFWWAIITMSTVGYGDYYPTSVAGYLIASVCAISGLILIGMPIPIIARNFNLYYGFRERVREKTGDIVGVSDSNPRQDKRINAKRSGTEKYDLKRNGSTENHRSE